MTSSLHKSPRLYVPDDLARGTTVSLPAEQAHYLKNVLRQEAGAPLRLFNGRDGEWLAEIGGIGKKAATAVLQEQIRPQPAQVRQISLLFSPIRKDRMDFMIEKAVELGATDIYPVLMHRTEVRRLNPERLARQIAEAAEQCERLTLPRLHDMTDLAAALAGWPRENQILACVERLEVPPLRDFIPARPAFLIGPEGGFSEEEKALLARSIAVRCVSLGQDILRAETAALYALSLARTL